MNQAWLINFCGISLGALILHSYFKRGLALTLNFFIFAVMLVFTKGGEHSFQFMNFTKIQPQTMFYAAISTLIWVVSFYLSWCMAEKIVQRAPYFNNRVFPVLLFAGIFVAFFAYALEATLTNIAESTIIANSNGFLVIPFYVVKKQFYFSIYFLAAYFLIACSEYKNKDWKLIFFLLPFINTWIPQFFGQGLAQFIKEMLTLATLIPLAFMCPLRFDYPKIKPPKGKFFLNTRWVDLLPLAVAGVLVFILFVIDVIKLHDMRLVASLLPVGFFMLFTIKRISLLWIIFIACLCFLGFKELAIPAIVFVGLLASFQLVSSSRFIKNNCFS